jgi:hypothetical protein
MRLILAYKNFAANRHISHIGLGVSAINTAKVLHDKGYHVEVWPILDGNHLRQQLNVHKNDADPVTHVVVSAPFIDSHGWMQISRMFPRIKFAMNCHSNVAFLQADRNGVRLIRDCMDLQTASTNFDVAGNSQKFVEWMLDAYNHVTQYLPNLYHLENVVIDKPLWDGGTLRVGCFGATRPLKNIMSAVGAAIEIAFQKKTKTEIWLSGGRTEGGGNTILEAAKQLVRGIPEISLVSNNWESWPAFRRTVGFMHLLLQPSFTESFNMVTADGISQGVPSVVSDAIDWAPKYWMAETDDVFDIAHTGRALLGDRHAARQGLEALNRHNSLGAAAWINWFSTP